MRVIVDAQLLRRLVYTLRGLIWDAVHTLDLPLGNRTPDTEIARLADREERFVVTKDADFVQANLLTGSPRRLIIVAAGNASNEALLRLFSNYANDIERFAEVGRCMTVSPLGVEPGLPLL